MSTITLPKTEYDKLQEIKNKYETVRQLFVTDLFEEPSTRNAKRIIKEFQNSGLYKQEFLKSLEKGLQESSYFK